MPESYWLCKYTLNYDFESKDNILPKIPSTFTLIAYHIIAYHNIENRIILILLS